LNLILLKPEEITEGNLAVVCGERAAEICRNHVIAPGALRRVGVLGGSVGQGVVRSLSGERLEIEVTFSGEAPPTLGVSLVLAVSRPQMLKRIFEGCATLGVDRLVLVASEYGQKSYLKSRVLESDAIMKRLYMGLEQGAATQLPDIRIYPRFSAFISEIDDLFPGEKFFRILAAPQADKSLAETGMNAGQDLQFVAAIGPEGGWSGREEASLVESAGFVPFSLGQRILRVETAVWTTLAQLAILDELNGEPFFNDERG
jgi:RsmE family RNA methyltransferase